MTVRLQDISSIINCNKTPYLQAFEGIDIQGDFLPLV
jgi:hypothetical protein